MTNSSKLLNWKTCCSNNGRLGFKSLQVANEEERRCTSSGIVKLLLYSP